MFSNDPSQIRIGDPGYFAALSRIQLDAQAYVRNAWRDVGVPAGLRAINASLPGTGKTRMAVGWADSIKTGKDGRPPMGGVRLLVVCPPSVARQWVAAFVDDGWNPDDLTLYEARKNPILLDADPAVTTPVTVVGTRLLALTLKNAKTAKAKRQADGWLAQFGALVLDEAHEASANSLALKQIQRLNPQFVYLLSATPSYNKPENMFTLACWLWPVRHMGWWDFVHEFCVTQTIARPKLPSDARKYPPPPEFISPKTGKAMVNMKVVTGWKPGGLDRFLGILPVVVKLRNEPMPYETHVVPCALTEVQRRIYDQIVDDAVAELGHGTYIGDFPIVDRIRLRQTCLAEPDFLDPEFSDEIGFRPDARSDKAGKIMAICRHHLAAGERVLVVSDSAKFIHWLADRWDDSSTLRTYTGRETAKQRRDTLGWFADTVGVLAMVYQAGATGLDGIQKACHVEVLANLCEPVGGALMQQFSGRLNRTGSPFDNIIRYELVATNTLEDVPETLDIAA